MAKPFEDIASYNRGMSFCQLWNREAFKTVWAINRSLNDRIWNSCSISELIELTWRPSFITTSDNTEEKTYFSNAICTRCQVVLEVSTWTHTALKHEVRGWAYQLEGNLIVEYFVCSENKRQFYAEIPWVIVGTDKMFLGTWRTWILEHSPKDSWEPKHRELTSLNDSFWKIYSELNKTLITYNISSQRRT